VAVAMFRLFASIVGDCNGSETGSANAYSLASRERRPGGVDSDLTAARTGNGHTATAAADVDRL
jgi:hypothetical protein